MKFARGTAALSICDRCGMQYPYRLLVPDGQNPNLRVHPSCRDEAHPAEKPVRTDEGIALKNPRPDRDDDSPGNVDIVFAESVEMEGSFGAALPSNNDALLTESGLGLYTEDGELLEIE